MRCSARAWLPAAAALAAAAPAVAQCPHAGATRAAAGEACIDTLALRAHTRFLADDALAGRGAGTRGERIAAAYIASELLRLGLRPLAGDDFLLPVPLAAARILPETRLSVGDGAGALAFEHGRDFLVNTGARTAFRDFAGPAVFVGTASDAVRGGAGRARTGDVVVVAGMLGADAARLVPAWTRAGVAGIVLLVPDAAQFELYVRSRGPERFHVQADVGDPIWQPDLPVLLAGPPVARALLAGTPEAADGRSVPLGRTVDARIAVDERDVPAANVAALLPGSDPALRDEIVLFTAHYDHLGVSTPDESGDSIYNGFSDNAAGVAMLLAIADVLRDRPPRRSVGFLFLTGEERGLLGSSFFAAQPPVPLERIAAVVNLDAGAPPAPPTSWRIAGGTASTAGAVAAAAAERLGWTADLGDPSPNSDYWPFLARGVPAIFLIPGPDWEGTTEPERAALRSRWDRYHQAGDHYHADFPFAGLRRYAALALETGRDLANAAQRPRIRDR